MKIKLLENMLNELSNGIIVLNLKREVIFVNKITKEYFTGNLGEILGNYLKCEYTVKEKTDCQKSTNCKKCLLNKSLEIAMKTKNIQILTDVKFSFGEKEKFLSCKINYLKDEEIFIVELINLSKTDEEITFLSKAFDKSRDIIFFKNGSLQYEYINQYGVDLFKMEKSDILGRKDSDLMPKENSEKCLDGDLETLKDGKSYNIESICGRLFKIEKEFLNGGILGVARDITDEIEATQSAEMDTLTGLYNRRKFMKVIDKIYNEKIYRKEFYLALLDLDDLRELNNKYGHLKGDEYLANVGGILNDYPEGMFFRLGGDEFVGLIPRDKKNVEFMFKSIFNRINSKKYTPKLSLSVGIKKLDLDESYLENFSKVDKLLYEVKRNGKNSFILE
ncbi:diguanylate cyclase [uncultured Cetobacterium sp.]|uniref:diguanylate cyclase domain-containing protein n=1 Tax=uncultured Cetobacterium sp. TaxID=527638 RepID=UPI002629CA09|nr:diguanylate cyclase [uncultured Cetobacterium sp.]